MTDSYNTLILIMGKCFITMFLIVVFFFTGNMKLVMHLLLSWVILMLQ